MSVSKYVLQVIINLTMRNLYAVQGIRNYGLHLLSLVFLTSLLFLINVQLRYKNHYYIISFVVAAVVTEFLIHLTTLDLTANEQTMSSGWFGTNAFLARTMELFFSHVKIQPFTSCVPNE